MGSNPGWVKLEVHGTSVKVTFEPKVTNSDEISVYFPDFKKKYLLAIFDDNGTF